ncbi:hypothetical protein BpHYR1_030289, partial [Brachionus plicatilis]
EDRSDSVKYIPTKKLNIHQIQMAAELGEQAPHLNQIFRCKSNADMTNNKDLSQNSDQPSEFKRIYENEFSMRLRAKSVDKAFANRAQNDNATNPKINSFNCPLNKNLVVNEQEMLRMAYRRNNNYYKNRELMEMVDFYNRSAYQYEPSYERRQWQRPGKVDWAYQMERERHDEFNRSRRPRKIEETNPVPQVAQKFFPDPRSQSIDSKSVSFKKDLSPERKVNAKTEAVQTTEAACPEAESKLVSELRSQMDLLKAEIARLQNAQSALEKNLKQQQSTVLRPIIYSGSNFSQNEYDEYSLDQFIQTDDQLFTVTDYSNFVNNHQLKNLPAAKNNQLNQNLINSENKIPLKPELNQVRNRVAPLNFAQNISSSCAPKIQFEQPKATVNPVPKIVPKENTVPLTTPLTVKPVSEAHTGPSSPNAQLYHKLLKLVSDSVNLSDSELSSQFNVLMSNGHIRTRLKQLHTQLLQDPNHYWPKLEKILLFENQGKDSINFQNFSSIQNKVQNLIKDLVELKKFYSEAAPSQKISCQTFAPQPRILNR